MKTFLILCFATVGTLVNAFDAEVNRTSNIISLRGNNSTCLLMSFKNINILIQSKNATIKKPYFTQTYNITGSGVKAIPVDIFKGESSCASQNGHEKLALDVSKNELIFDFMKYENSYNLSSIKFLVRNISSANFTIKDGTNSSHTRPDLTVPHINIGKLFNCKRPLVYKFDLTTSESIEIKIEGLRFSAFRSSNTTQFDEPAIECKTSKSKPGNDIIPIAVGGVLTLFLISSLVAYVVIKHRK
jgi:hypothetical protein